MTKINTNPRLATGKVCINLDPHTTNQSLKAAVGHPTPFRSAVLFATNLENDNQKDETDFWAQQKRLATSISAEVEQEVKTLKQLQAQRYSSRLNSLLSDNIYFSLLIFSILWSFSYNPMVGVSYLFGSILGTLYSFGLGKYVESIKSGEERLDSPSAPGEGLGQARFAFVFILLILLGKFRGESGLQEIPTIAGFFTYQLASLSQGFKELDEE